MKNRLRAATLLMGLVGSLAAPVDASPILFDNSSRGDFSTIRDVGDSPLAAITVGVPTDIDQIGVMNDLGISGNLKFLIFDLGTSALLLSTASQPFADTGLSFKLSNVFPAFTLLPGVTYGIGAIADVGALWRTNNSSSGSPFTQNGITASDDFNGNVANFANPTRVGNGTAMIIVALAGPEPGPAPVPEPTTLLLLGVGLAAASCRRWLTSV
jgi:hypothetical protein